MPKIIFNEDEPIQNHSTVHHARRGGQFIVGFLILALIMGMAGGVGMMLLISENATVRHALGFNDNGTVPSRTVTEKLVVEESNGFIDTVKKVSPAVVSITTKKEGVDLFGQIYQQEGAGTGFIITSDGLIVTNKHVVAGENAEYTVVTTEGKTYTATVKARDPFNDLAVLKIEATGLPVVELGDSDAVEVGQWVLAIGNALGEFKNSVSVGVVSAKDRKLDAEGSAELTGLIQTDAAINPGNSGGPLVNLRGQVIGIDTAIASTTGSSIGIGFAIPVNSIKKAIDSVRKTGTITRPMLGVSYINIDSVVQDQLKLTVDHGALIRGNGRTSGLAAGGPADVAGVEDGDIILEINGERIDEDHSLSNRLVNYSPGDEVKLKILRNGKEQTVTVKLGEMPTR